MTCDICNVYVGFNRATHLERFHSVKLNRVTLTREEKAAIERRAEERFGTNLVTHERSSLVPITLDTVAVETDVRPPLMTDDEILMSIERLAGDFCKQVEVLKGALRPNENYSL